MSFSGITAIYAGGGWAPCRGLWLVRPLDGRGVVGASVVYHAWGVSHSEIPRSVLREPGLRK